MRNAFIATLLDAALRDPRIVLITGDLGFGVLNEFATRLPRQFINAGVAEQNMTALACGMAMSGRKVFTYSIANFTTLRCLEQIRNDVCYHKADVTAVAVGGGFSYGQLGMSHFATEDIAILRALPNMKVFAPTGIWETQEATKAILRDGGPSYLRLDKGLADSAQQPGEIFSPGKMRKLREGSDITLIATGGIMAEALAASERLAAHGMEARVLSAHTIKPLDHDAIIAAAQQTGGIVTLEEHNILGGLGGAVAEACLDAGVAPKIFLRLGTEDVFSTIVGDQSYLRHVYGLDAGAIETRVLAKTGFTAKS